MTQAQIEQLSRDIAKALKPMVLDLLASGAPLAIKPLNEMDKVVTRRQLWPMLNGGPPHQPNGGEIP